MLCLLVTVILLNATLLSLPIWKLPDFTQKGKNLYYPLTHTLSAADGPKEKINYYADQTEFPLNCLAF